MGQLKSMIKSAICGPGGKTSADEGDGGSETADNNYRPLTELDHYSPEHQRLGAPHGAHGGGLQLNRAPRRNSSYHHHWLYNQPGTTTRVR